MNVSLMKDSKSAAANRNTQKRKSTRNTSMIPSEGTNNTTGRNFEKRKCLKILTF